MIPHFYKRLPGWFDFEDLYLDWINAAPSDKLSTFVEVGCWHGRSLAFLATQAVNSGKTINVYGVDLFEFIGGHDSEIKEPPPNADDVRSVFLGHAVPVYIMQSTSWDAAAQFDDNSIDRCFIDADHAYESVRKDIAAWWPKVRVGGCLAGHDYQPVVHADVIRAVQEFCAAEGLKYRVQGYCWIVEKV